MGLSYKVLTAAVVGALALGSLNPSHASEPTDPVMRAAMGLPVNIQTPPTRYLDCSPYEGINALDRACQALNNPDSKVKYFSRGAPGATNQSIRIISGDGVEYILNRDFKPDRTIPQVNGKVQIVKTGEETQETVLGNNKSYHEFFDLAMSTTVTPLVDEFREVVHTGYGSGELRLHNSFYGGLVGMAVAISPSGKTMIAVDFLETHGTDNFYSFSKKLSPTEISNIAVFLYSKGSIFNSYGDLLPQVDAKPEVAIEGITLHPRSAAETNIPPTLVEEASRKATNGTLGDIVGALRGNLKLPF